MYERMLDKQVVPTVEEMTASCGEAAPLFAQLNAWLANTCGTVPGVVFPYGNGYGWGVAHRKKKKLCCNIFAENNAFTVMLRLSDAQFASVYDQLRDDTRALIDRRYPCGDGGWIHFRVTGREQLDDVQKLLAVKCAS